MKYEADDIETVYNKCPNCGYEYEMVYDYKRYHENITKGDKSFVKIDCIGRPFETDKNLAEPYEDSEYAKVYLYGCPKCKSIHYEECDN